MAAAWIRIRRVVTGVVLFTKVSAQASDNNATMTPKYEKLSVESPPADNPRIGAIGLDETKKTETCSVLNVTGGADPGIYLNSQDLRGRKPYFLATNEVTPAMLKYLDISEHRRLLEGSEPGAVTRSFSEIDNLAWRAYEKVDARRGHGQDAEKVDIRHLTVCPYGFWINAYEVYSNSSHSSAEDKGYNYTYPLFLVPDCADHPADVISTWYELACESCDPEATTVTVQCLADERLSTNTTPAPSGVPTAIVGTNVPSAPPAFPTIDNSAAPSANTPAPSSSRVTPTPTGPRVTPDPTLPGTTTPGSSPIGPGTTPTPGLLRTTPSPNLDPSETPVPSDDESVSPTIGPSASASVSMPSPSGVGLDGTTSTLAPSAPGIGVRGDLAESGASMPGIACIASLIGPVVAAMGAEAFPALLLQSLQ